jgi:serine/threonine protein kinase
LSSIPYTIEELRAFPYDRQLDIICDAFEDQWKRGRFPDIGEYSRMASPEFHARILRELIQLETECIDVYGKKRVSRKEPEGNTMRQKGKSDNSPETGNKASPFVGFPTHFDRYLLLRVLGKGKYGTVYEADDLRTNRRVALKIANLDSIGSPVPKAFEREASNTVKISHPTVVNVWEVGEFQGTSYMASELVQGKDLRAILDRQRLPIRSAVELVAEIALGTHAAHQQGIVHRDLKPSSRLTAKISH